MLMKSKNYAGLFLIAMATLMLEIMLTRIFSVTTWYHFAFMSISTAMFGMTLGSIAVYLFPKFFSQEKVNQHLALSSLLFSATIIASFLFHITYHIGFNPTNSGILSITLNFIVISIPFFFSGICICTALTKFPDSLSKLYAADLAGAAIGCVALLLVLNITDGPNSIFIISLIAMAAAIIFSDSNKNKLSLKNISIFLSAVLSIFIAVSIIKSNFQQPIINIGWGKGFTQGHKIYEKWNTFSRIQVEGYTNKKRLPMGWGLSEKYLNNDIRIEQLQLYIDTGASTVITKFDGKLGKIDYLKYDLTNFVHYFRNNANMAIIGTGGGRDILSALAFGQKKITGIEINNNIIDTVQKRFGDFSGHLYSNPKVKVVNDEARSYISRSKEKFDIIQASLVDTSAATAAGAFTLTENSLYTVEAWKTFMNHLTDRGILTFSRWYSEKNPAEIYRLTSLARETLIESGIKSPKDHIMIICQESPSFIYGISTILVSKKPFSNEDIKIAENISKKLGFRILLHPRYASELGVANIILNYANITEFLNTYPYDISPPTDNKPFFFNMFKFDNLLKGIMPNRTAANWYDNQAIFTLSLLLIIVTILTIICIFFPLAIRGGKVNPIKISPYLLYFSSIGLGFMMIEISQMQRLIIFLGHPVYGLSVILFTLLLAGGTGSYLTNIFREKESFNRISLIILAGTILSLSIFGILTPYIIDLFRSSTNIVRILASIVIIFPIGIFMGTAFPIGMKASSGYNQDLTPWLWGINGATSVCASVIAVIISMTYGIKATFWTGVFCYIFTLLSFMWIILQNRKQSANK